VYRAFPELDRFPDDQCERFVERAKNDYPESQVRASLLALVVVVAVIVGLFYLERTLWAAWSARIAGRLEREHLQDIVVVLSALSYALLLCLGMLIARDRWLIRTITLRVHQTSCPSCGYSLLGLVVDKGVIVCPECAAPFFLADHGMTEEDLIATAGAEPPRHAPTRPA
jgi:hypothetical protein